MHSVIQVMGWRTHKHSANQSLLTGLNVSLQARRVEVTPEFWIEWPGWDQMGACPLHPSNLYLSLLFTLESRQELRKGEHILDLVKGNLISTLVNTYYLKCWCVFIGCRSECIVRVIKLFPFQHIEVPQWKAIYNYEKNATDSLPNTLQLIASI